MNATFKILKIMENSLLHSDFIFNRIPGLAGIFSRKGKILKGNDHLGRVMNCLPDVVNTKSLEDFIDLSEVFLFKSAFKQADKGKEVSFVTKIKDAKKDGYDVKYAWTVSFLIDFNDRDMKTYLITGSDITDMSIAQEKLVEANATLEEKVKERTKDLQATMEELKDMQGHMVTNARMASLGEMAGNMAHEINNPLNIINLSLRSVSKGLAKDDYKNEKIEKHIDKMERMVKRMGEIIANLKGFSRDASNDPMQYYNVKQLIDDSVFVLNEKFQEEKVDLQIKIEGFEELEIYCNKVALNQVIVNLIQNSFDVVKDIKEGERWVRIGFNEIGTFVEFYIMDSGRGVEKENVDRIFEPFFTTKELGAGTGLGLSMAKGIVEKQHRGSLFYNPTHPPTCFVIQLPKNLEELGEGESADIF